MPALPGSAGKMPAFPAAAGKMPALPGSAGKMPALPAASGSDLGAIAIIGMAGRFPGARNPEQLWRNLRAGVESISFFTPEELRRAGVAPALLANPAYVPAKAIVDDVFDFDAGFFAVPPREAELTDPQHRFFLECAWEALEDAGYEPRRCAGKIGLFGGAGVNSYLLLHLLGHPALSEPASQLLALIHNKNDHLCTRVGYKLDFGGPCVTVQTACSTSLVAVSLACQSLLDYQCDLALAGGSTIVLPQISGYLYQAGGIASPDGHCRVFAADANGTVDGNGTGLVVLKRLDDALSDLDRIRAVIRGWAINNDGAQKTGYTAPSVDRQAEVIALAQGLAEVSPDTISYLEAHGTGTPLGDPIELAALTRAFRRGTDRRGFCAIGSVKSNLGHLDTAAGVTGLIKTTLALEHGEIPPSLHSQPTNPQIDFAQSPFFVAAELLPWPRGAAPRRAGVSSFGIGGTNAHLVLEEAPARAPARPPSRGFQVLLLSARSAPALEVATEQLAARLDALRQNATAGAADQAGILADVAYTLQVGRRRFAHRRAVLARNLDEAIAGLTELVPERVITRVEEVDEGGTRPVIFMFPGQGTQHPGMGSTLYREEPVLRDWIDQCAQLLQPEIGTDLRQLLAPSAQNAEQLTATRWAQPALFALEFALAQLWLSFGVVPQAMIGHSIGEYVAACLAGTMSLKAALSLVATRGRLIQELPAGAMLSIALPEKDVLPLLSPELAIAAVNGPALTVVAGPPSAVAELATRLDRLSITVRQLHTSHAFHSPMMEPIRERFAAAVAEVALAKPQIPWISNLTGDWIRAEEATDPGYWVRHLLQPVRFADGILTLLLQEPRAVFLEVGPGRTLKIVTRWHPKKTPDQVVETSLPHPSDPISDDLALHSAVARLAVAGVEVDWERYHNGPRPRVPLPTYPFERRRYWLPPTAGLAGAGSDRQAKKPDLSDWFYLPVWRETVPRSPDAAAWELPWLVFLDPLGVGAKLAARLEQQGARVTTVALGDTPGLKRAGDTSNPTYTLAPGDREGFLQLLRDLREQGQPPRRILHLWSLSGELEVPALSAWAALQDRVFYSLLFLAQALAEDDSAEPPTTVLLVVSDGLHAVTEELPTAWPEKAALLGAVKTIPREFPHLICRSLDLATRELGYKQTLDPLIPQILAAATPADPAEIVVAVRGRRRFLQEFAPLQLGPAAHQQGLRHGGCYLLTGGLGGIGLHVAEFLARTVAAKLVFLSRSPGPPRAAWEAQLAARPHDLSSHKIRRLLQLEAAGSELLVLAADVTDPEQVTQAVAAARTRFGHIHGVFHAAGIAGGGLIQRRTREATRAVFAPKITGVRVLAAALADDPPELWVLFSSLARIVGRLGQVDYCAANAVLAALAHDLSRSGARAVALDWGEWLATGMAADPLAARAEAQDGEVTALAHPLLERRRVLPSGEEIYATDFAVKKHWVVDEHRLVGNPVIPGVAYVEMVRAALGERAQGLMIEFRDLYFVAPLRVRDDRPREVRVRLRAEAEGFSFTVESDADADEGTSGPREYALGKVRLLPPTPMVTLDLPAIQADCADRVAVFREEEREDDLGPRWQNVQRAYVGSNQVLTHLALPEDFAPDFAVMQYHPSLMDRAAGVAKEYLFVGTYLPLSYQVLRIKGPVPREIYTWARYRPEVDPSRETLTFDTAVMDAAGRVLVEFESFSQKLVKDAAVKIKSYAGHGDWGHTLESPRTAAGAHDPLPREMLPAEGIAALHRILAGPPWPQVAVSVRDLAAEIADAGASAQELILHATERQRSAGLAARHPRPELPTAYVAPQSELESQLATVWQELLGIAPIGIHDDFFQLGGDSVQAIQIIAALGKVGLTITPQQFFQHGTIAQLAALARQPEGAEAAPDAPPAADPPGLSAPPAPADFSLADLDSGTLAQLSRLIDAADEPPGERG